MSSTDRSDVATRIIEETERLSAEISKLEFSAPVAYVYSPLEYATEPHEAYLRRFARGRKKVLFVGMNPGPWGMTQTGVPFGEINAVKVWMGLESPVGRPDREHPKRPVEGFACTRSEVSGRRFWGLMRSRFDSADAFFADHFVANYCPLMFLEESGRNRTPEKLRAEERRRLFSLCDDLLAAVMGLLAPEWVVGIGKFAERRLLGIVGRGTERSAKIASLLHPSPANPGANRGWAETAERQLVESGVWA